VFAFEAAATKMQLLLRCHASSDARVVFNAASWPAATLPLLSESAVQLPGGCPGLHGPQAVQASGVTPSCLAPPPTSVLRTSTP